MAGVEDVYKTHIEKLLQAIYATKYIKEDNIPCEIEEGLYLGSLGAAHNKDGLKMTDREGTDLTRHFAECFDFIDEAKTKGGGVLVHCFAGKSRSVTIIVAYLMQKRRLSLSQAVEHVKNRRPKASPNPGFIRQLQNFEKSLEVNEAEKTE
ncbi:hypothetical protein MKW98_023442 [Papaver atlanticum]|uniref:protein-tyrosine-phosphatase n=1 Tax=Papaver atlanticum TaxID=357466 RepID=A0AAD4SZ19_9MAGN|nr:hypothetical protein MKW98_023442 [Papaver atlanticum]